ncbi:CD209 antigen-like protein E [Clytia hemisphaerica]
MKFIFAISILIVFVNTLASADFFRSFRSTEYRYFKQQVLWPEAQSECKKQKGHLVTVDSEDEFEYLMSNLREFKINRTWIGLNDMAQEGQWRWEYGDSSAGYIKFGKGEPNNAGNEDCVELVVPINGYNDLPCSKGNLRRRGFICEIE